MEERKVYGDIEKICGRKPQKNCVEDFEDAGRKTENALYSEREKAECLVQMRYVWLEREVLDVD